MLTQRQSKILAAIVKEYSRSGHPVGSEELAERYGFDVSSATIRNEMKALEEAGFINQPHTSAGRVPTDRGYRFFVNKLMNHLELRGAEQMRLRQELVRIKKEYIELGRSISKLLAEQAEGAAFAMLPASPLGGPDSIGTSGLSKVVSAELPSATIQEIADFMDELEKHGHELIQKGVGQVETFIGREAPVPFTSECSLVVSRVNLPSGKQGLIGIVGPKRMQYARNISLLEYVSKLLSSGVGALILISLY